MEPTGADSPSQNGAVEIYNDKFGIWTRSLLYGSGLPAKYWLAALVHSVYFHNCLVHLVTGYTPFEAYYKIQPDLKYLKIFGSCVCVKRSGNRRAKLDRHNFCGIFLGYTATDQNIVYLDLDTGIIKQSHHATFDKVWYLQPSCPPAAQLLYYLGLEEEHNPMDEEVLSTGITTPPLVPWPPPCPISHKHDKWTVPPCPRMLSLPLWETALPCPYTAAAARVRVLAPVALEIVTEYNINRSNMATVYMSPDPFFGAFKEEINLQKWSFEKHRTAGILVVEHHGRLYIGNMVPGSPGAKVDKWHLHVRGAWLIQVGDTTVSTMMYAESAFKQLYDGGAPTVTLLLSHPELCWDISHNGLPIISTAPFTQLTHDQLNHC